MFEPACLNPHVSCFGQLQALTRCAPIEGYSFDAQLEKCSYFFKIAFSEPALVQVT
jgi:hypothetical protein